MKILILTNLDVGLYKFRKELLDALIETCRPTAIYERSDAAIRAKEGLEEKCGWIYKSGKEVISIEEHGLRLRVDIAKGQKTGYFLDQKCNREAIKRFCHGKKVLDAFSHTGAFGLNAFKAGAKSVLSVDISEEAVDLIKDNIRAHMTELFESPLFTTSTEHSAPQGKTQNFLQASAKKMIIFGVAAAVVACGIWFLAALAPEFRRGREEDALKAEKSGKEAAEA